MNSKNGCNYVWSYIISCKFIHTLYTYTLIVEYLQYINTWSLHRFTPLFGCFVLVLVFKFCSWLSKPIFSHVDTSFGKWKWFQRHNRLEAFCGPSNKCPLQLQCYILPWHKTSALDIWYTESSGHPAPSLQKDRKVCSNETGNTQQSLIQPAHSKKDSYKVPELTPDVI